MKRRPGEFRSRPVGAGTRLVAIFGWPLVTTLSPRFQNAALAQGGADAVYVALPAPTPDAFRRLARGLMDSPRFVGANITHPYKVHACRLPRSLSPEARAMGAVNTLARRNGQWVGHNTDAAGFRAALGAEGIRLGKAAVVVLGAGGAARAAVWASGRAGARSVVVLARRRSQARTVASLAGGVGKPGSLEDRSILRWAAAADLVVNALPGGALGGSMGLLLPRPARPGAAAMDLSYAPPRTAFLVAAGRRGWREVSGLGMLVEQGREAYRLWFGAKPARDLLEASLRKV